MSDFLLALQDVHVNFPARKNWLGKVTERVHALNGLDLQIRQGETLGIVGESGCGKSTLAQLLMGMLKPSQGSYSRRGDKQHNGMQMVFQDPLSSLDPRLPVWRTITEPVWIQKRSPERERRMLAEDLAQQVGIRPEYLDRLPLAFSGGQRQRIAIARALSSEPEVIVLDEPTSALDISVQAQILNLLVSLQARRNLTYVLISHNVSVVRHMSDRVAVMYLGQIVELGDAQLEEGDVWGRILKILEEKVRAGVEVRVLYDGTCTFYRLPYGYPKRMEALGIRCKMFAPLRPFVSTYYNNRDHRKIAVIDGRVGFTGGVNLSDEYANLVSVYGVWKDTAVRLEGEAVRSLTLMFLQMWGMDEREPDTESYGRYLNVPLPPLPEAGGYVLPYADSPLDDERVGESVYLDILSHAERYVRIFTPYLILDETMIMALTFAAKRGVDVELILPHVPDKKFAFALAKGHYCELLDAGVKIYEYTPGFVHAKVFVSDDCKAVVGTINLDYRSLYLHFENAVYLYDCPCIADIVADFDATRAQSQIVTHGDLARIPLHTRITSALLKLVAPLM